MTKQPTEKPTGGKRIKKILLIFGLSVLGLLLAAVITYFILYQVGKSSLLDYENVSIQFPTEDTTANTEESENPEIPATTQEHILSYDDGKTVSYQGQTYHLNENIATLLFIGIDKRDWEESTVNGAAGEADCILLIAMDTETGETKVVNISRDSYAHVDIYSGSGNYIESRSTQLCRAFAFGDGQAMSCENVAKSVSRLLYGLPIHSYIGVNMQAVRYANDAIGGVTLACIGDITSKYYHIGNDGEEVTLKGINAQYYLSYRDKSRPDGNVDRMQRQKQYVKLFMSKLMKESKKDVTTLLDLYTAVDDYTFTGLSLAEVTFLATCFVENGANFDFITLEGKADMLGENAIYYLDRDHLYETVLDVFYTPVN